MISVIFAATLHLSTAAPCDVDCERAFQESTRTGADFFAITTDDDGNVASVNGVFEVNVGTTRAYDTESERLIAQVHAFVKSFSAAYGISAQRETGWIQPISVHQATDSARVLTFEQYAAGLRVRGRQGTAVFDFDGNLVALIARFDDWAPLDAVAQDENIVVGVVAAENTDGVTSAERVYDSDADAVVWEVTVGDSVFVVDEASLMVVHQYSHVSDYAIDDAWMYVKNYTQDLNDATIQPPYTTKSAYTGYNDFFGNCTWNLSYSTSSHSLSQLVSDVYSEATESIPCGSTPTFNAISGTHFIQQTGYFFTKLARNYFVTHMWSGGYPPQRTADVTVHVDAASTACTGAAACFYGSSTDVYVEEGTTTDWQIFVHEYAHYLSWTYNGFSSNCIFNADEGVSLNEAVSKSMELVIASQPYHNAEYYENFRGIATQSSTSNTIVAHIQNGDNRQYQDRCPSKYAHASPFTQAIWELLHNLDCGAVTCTSTTDWGNAIWIGATTATVADQVSEALAYAMSVTSTSVSYRGFITQMMANIQANYGTATKNRAQAVFTHHGF